VVAPAGVRTARSLTGSPLSRAAVSLSPILEREEEHHDAHDDFD